MYIHQSSCIYVWHYDGQLTSLLAELTRVWTLQCEDNDRVPHTRWVIPDFYVIQPNTNTCWLNFVNLPKWIMHKISWILVTSVVAVGKNPKFCNTLINTYALPEIVVYPKKHSANNTRHRQCRQICCFRQWCYITQDSYFLLNRCVVINHANISLDLFFLKSVLHVQASKKISVKFRPNFGNFANFGGWPEEKNRIFVIH